MRGFGLAAQSLSPSSAGAIFFFMPSKKFLAPPRFHQRKGPEVSWSFFPVPAQRSGTDNQVCWFKRNCLIHQSTTGP